MRKIRAEIRMIPDTILKLIKMLGKTYDKSRKLTNAEVVSIAVAKLTGYYVLQGDGTYVYTPQYEVCPDCSGLINKEDFNNPPPNTKEYEQDWKAIKRQHVTKCTWLAMAMAGNFSKQPILPAQTLEERSKANVIKMRHNPTIDHITEVQSASIEDTIELNPKVQETISKPIEKPSLDSIDFEGMRTEQYIDEFGAVKQRTTKVVRKKIIDDSTKSVGRKDADNVSVTMEIGDTLGQNRNAEFQSKMGSRKSFQGLVTEKNVDDKTMVMKIDVQGNPPDVKEDTGARIEKDPDLSKPMRVAKARVSQSSGSIKSLDDLEFE